MYSNLSEETTSPMVFDDLVEFLSRPEDYFGFISGIIEGGSGKVKSILVHKPFEDENDE